jgi:hypothetical protein
MKNKIPSRLLDLKTAVATKPQRRRDKHLKGLITISVSFLFGTITKTKVSVVFPFRPQRVL